MRSSYAIVVFATWLLGCSPGEADVVEDHGSALLDQPEDRGYDLRAALEISNGNGWSIGKPRAVVENEDSEIFVLDSDRRRISVHLSQSGEWVRNIGSGDSVTAGPFALAVDMCRRGSTVVVLDYIHQSLLLFDKLESTIENISVDGPEVRTFTCFESGYVFKLMHPRDGNILARLDQTGRNAALFHRLTDHELDLLGTGLAGAVTTDQATGNVIYANADGSHIRWYSGDSVVRELRPYRPAVFVDKAVNGDKLRWRLAGHSIGGIAAISDSLVAVVSGRLKSDLPTRDDRPIRATELSVFDSFSGVRRAVLDVSEYGIFMNINRGFEDGTVFVSFAASPGGRVVKFDLARRASSSRD